MCDPRGMESNPEAFLRVAAAIRHLFHQLRALAESAMPPLEGFTASHRAVLESLALQGPQTVPALARARPVARQHIQVLINELLDMGLVETIANPAHKRSPLARLTAAGKRRFEEIRDAERALLRRAKLPIAGADLRRLGDELELLSSGLRDLLAPIDAE